MNVSMVQVFINKGVNVKVVDKVGLNLLYMCVLLIVLVLVMEEEDEFLEKFGVCDVIQLFVFVGLEVNSIDNVGFIFLYFVLREKDVVVIIKLL